MKQIEKLQAAPIGVVKQLVLCRNLRLFGSSLEPMPNFHDTVYEYGNFCPLAIRYNENLSNRFHTFGILDIYIYIFFVVTLLRTRFGT